MDVSSPATGQFLGYADLMASLATFVRAKRDERGWTQAALASRADVPQQTVADIERGRSKLPGPEYRRRLARALGVSHIDLLIAAGELAPEEVSAAGLEPVVTYAPDDPKQKMHRMIEELATAADVAWTLELLERTQPAITQASARVRPSHSGSSPE